MQREENEEDGRGVRGGDGGNEDRGLEGGVYGNGRRTGEKVGERIRNLGDGQQAWGGERGEIKAKRSKGGRVGA